MTKTRLEAFTDAVIAIIMTILVLELEPPENASLYALLEVKFQFFIYLISFITLAIYWINHHHLFQVVRKISGETIWLNTILILFMSLIPFTTAYVNRHVGATVPEFLYGFVLLLTDVTWLVLAKFLVKANGENSEIKKALDGSKKSYISISLIIVGIIVGFLFPFITLVACMLSLLPWVIPSKKIEKIVKNRLD